MTFPWSQEAWAEPEEAIRSATAQDAQRALLASSLSYDSFLSLLSPAASGLLEAMARRAHSITVQRFGRVIRLYGPLYLSNECVNLCPYCAFNRNMAGPRRTLSPGEVSRELEEVRRQGLRHILLVAGDAPQVVDEPYLKEAVALAKGLFPSVSLEIAPLDREGYAALADVGADGLVLYQETYDIRLFEKLHGRGRKGDFAFRLAAPDQAARAGMRRLGLGSLLGLADWRLEAAALARHALYLMKQHWQVELTISLPRLRPVAGGLEPLAPVSDREMVQMLLAFRLLLPDVGLVLSTRERPAFRDRLMPLGITQMSAGSRTEPGGYGEPSTSQAQFSVEDTRSVAEVATAIQRAGFDPVTKDWDGAFGAIMEERWNCS